MRILFYKPTTIMGKLIKLFSPLFFNKQAKYSHVGIQLDDYHILDINSGRNSEIRHIKAGIDDFDIVEIDLLYGQRKRLYSSIIKYIDKDYDYLKAVGLKGDINKYTCYELVIVILYDIGYLDRLYDVDLPEELIEILESRIKSNI